MRTVTQLHALIRDHAASSLFQFVIDVVDHNTVEGEPKLRQTAHTDFRNRSVAYTENNNTSRCYRLPHMRQTVTLPWAIANS